MKYFFPTCILFIIITGCRDDEKVEIPDCIEVTFGIPEPQIIYDVPYHASPCFNPNNPDELLYVDGNQKNRVLKYNLQTQTKDTIYNGNEIYFRPKWGKRGWILLNLSDGQIWKIKSNGDSLTQLTVGGGHFHPEWNDVGDQFICQQNLSSSVNMVIYDENGLILKTFPDFNVGSSIIWENPDVIISGTYHSVYTFHLLDSVLTEFAFYEPPPGLGGGVLLSDPNSIVWSCQAGIYKSMITEVQTIQLKSSCNSQIYTNPTYSESSGRIVFQRLDRTNLENNQMRVSSRLYSMNMDGTDEERLEILD